MRLWAVSKHGWPHVDLPKHPTRVTRATATCCRDAVLEGSLVRVTLPPAPGDPHDASAAEPRLVPIASEAPPSRTSALSAEDALAALGSGAAAPAASKLGTVAPAPLTVVSPGAREAQLAKVPLFAGLTEEALGRIAAISHEESHATGTRIFQYGDAGDKLFILLEGKVRISREISGMGEEALAVLGPGEVFGEMALFDESPRSADARAHERCRLLVIEKEAFDDLLFVEKDLAYEVLWACVRILASRMRETNDKLAFLSTSSRF